MVNMRWELWCKYVYVTPKFCTGVVWTVKREIYYLRVNGNTSGPHI